MQAFDLWDLHQALERADILICFNGPLSQSIIEQIGVAIRRHLGEEAIADEKIYDVFSVYIEQTQNIRNYARDKAGLATGARLDAATLAIGRRGDGCYTISAGNVVLNSDLPALCERVETLAAMPPEDLQAHYKQARRALRHSEAASAGLGLIDMARKASEPLRYQVRHIDDASSFFHLTTAI